MNKFNPFENFMSYMKRNFTNFDMSNYMQFSTNLGEMTPIRRDFVMPSDFWHGSTSSNIRVAPLVAPAFTKINAFIQSYYVSFPSIWKYWNQFISNRPADSFLNSANLSKFDGVYCEPLIPMQLIAILCKIHYGYYGLQTEEIGIGSIGGIRYKLVPGRMSKTKFVYDHLAIVNGRRLRSAEENMDDYTLDNYFDREVRLFEYYAYDGVTHDEFGQNLGYENYNTFLFAQIKNVIRNLQNFGLPTELIASSSMALYENESINALPFIAQSKIWQEYIRNPQVQGTELDYYEINGSICRVYTRNNPTGTLTPINFENCNQYSWQCRLTDIPYGYQSRTFIDSMSTYAAGNIDYTRAMAVLTGIDLRNFIIDYESSVESIAILPNYYNGLLTLKYRNFENDYFTSAAPDPMMGRQSIPVPGTIEELRSASKLEEFLEANTAARNFYDFLKHHFGTTAKSVVYGRPEFLGSTRVPINISEQLQSSQTTQGENGSPLGSRAGVGDGFGSGTTISKNFDEHGIIITYMSFVIDNQYYQGFPFELEHHKDYLDLPWPEFSNLGLESIPSKYLYFGDSNNGQYFNSTENLAVMESDGDIFNLTVTPNDPTGSNNSRINQLNLPFGYSPRYAKYKFKLDQLSGEFNDQLEFWNTFRQFMCMPRLSHNFLSYENAVFMSNLDRIFATSEDIADRFYVNVFNDYSVSRCLPLVANPQLD